MEMTVNVPKGVEHELYKKAREEIESGLTEEALLKYMSENDSPSVKELLRSFNIYRRYEEITNSHRPISELTCNEKLICMLYWMMYEQLGR